MAGKWSYSAGEYGCTVTVYERLLGGPIYVRIRGAGGTYIRRSLRHTDRELAKSYADMQAARLRQGESDVQKGVITLAELFALYDRFHLPAQAKKSQVEDRRRLQMWIRVLGPGKDPHKITLGEWEWFKRTRRSGALSASGAFVPVANRKPVRAITVCHDLRLLRAALSWGSRWRTASGRYLLQEDPTRGYPYPTIKNRRRPVATRNRYDALCAVAGQVQMRVYWGREAHYTTSYFGEVLDIVVGTGRRISQVLKLRYEDLKLKETPVAPWGAIRWPLDTDKTGREYTTPISPEVRAAVDRALEQRPGIGSAYLFPAPMDRSKPLPRHTANLWLARAEELIGLQPLKGGIWHPYRRMWATERKHLPLPDVAKAGGWRNERTMQLAYQHADDRTVLEAVLGRGALRETGSEGAESGTESGTAKS